MEDIPSKPDLRKRISTLKTLYKWQSIGKKPFHVMTKENEKKPPLASPICKPHHTSVTRPKRKNP